jgi:peptidoglycan hydrolase-like protein with peptidoglycan-binding domain
MTTIAKDIAAKLAVATVAVAMMFAAFAPAAQAQTTEELQAMINDLLAQVAALQSGGDSMTSSSDVCPFTWTRDLSSGSTGGDVMTLQKFLNSDADTRVAATGAGSMGMETEYYGPATAAAVSKFQVKYRADILSPAGLVNPTGYFGPSSRGKANALCIASAVEEEVEEGMEEEEETTDEGFTLSGEASLDDFSIDSADEDELEEGAEDAPVAELTFEFTDGDAEISRIDITVDGTGNDETDPWDVFETFQLWVDGDMVAEEAADDEDDYLDDTTGEFRFSGLSLFGEEDEELEIILAVTLQNSLDGVDDGETWNFEVDAIRFFDADGVATTEDSGFDFNSSVSVDIEEAGFEDELIVKTSSSDPDAATLQLEDDSKSDWYTVFVFDLDTDDSVNDIEINSIPVTFDVSSGTVATFVDDFELVIDGTTIDDWDYNDAGADTSTIVTFDVDGDVVIDAGDRVAAELMVRFKSLALGNEGVTASGTVTTANADAIDAEGADDLDATQLGGSASGDDHTLRTAGADVSPEATSAEVTVNDSTTDDYGTFEIEVEVTAFEQDVYINTDPATSIVYTLQDGSGSTSVAGSRSVTLTSSADEVGSYFEITEGQTETLTLTVTYTPGVANTASRMVLNSITFAEDSSNTNPKTQTTLPATDYRTSVITMVN